MFSLNSLVSVSFLGISTLKKHCEGVIHPTCIYKYEVLVDNPIFPAAR